MKFLTRIFVCLIFYAVPANAQIYFNNNYEYNSKVANATAIINVDDGYIFPSCIYGNGYGSFLMVKIDLMGDTIWTKEYKDSLHTFSTGTSNSIIKTIDNNFVFAGSILNSFSNRDALIVKFNLNGDTLWTKTYGGVNFDNANIVCQTADSGFVLMGVTQSFSSGSASDFYLIKTDKNGNQQWQHNYGTTAAEDCVSGQVTLDGGYIMSGIKSNALYILKTDASGNFEWDKLLSGTAGTAFIKQLADSSYLVVGAKAVSGLSYQAYMAKLTKTGAYIWQKTYGGVNDEQFYSIPVILSDGSIAVSGQSMLGSIPVGLLIKTDSVGTQQWLRTYLKNSSADNYFYDVKSTIDNGFIMSGFTLVATSDPWVVKVDEFGCEVANCNVGINEYQASAEKLVLFPNPAGNEINFQIPDLNILDLKIEILNVLGEVQDFQISASKIDVSQLAKGVYFISIRSKSGSRWTEKFVKE